MILLHIPIPLQQFCPSTFLSLNLQSTVIWPEMSAPTFSFICSACSHHTTSRCKFSNKNHCTFLCTCPPASEKLLINCKLDYQNRKFQKETDDIAWREWDPSNMNNKPELYKGNKKAQILTRTGAGEVFHKQTYSHNLFTVQQHYTDNFPKT